MRKKREADREIEKKVGKKETVAWPEWDKGKYPVRAAWEVAVARSERAKRYAQIFPEKVHADDLRYQDLDWQYHNEGLPSVKIKETIVIKEVKMMIRINVVTETQLEGARTREFSGEDPKVLIKELEDYLAYVVPQKCWVLTHRRRVGRWESWKVGR